MASKVKWHGDGPIPGLVLVKAAAYVSNYGIQSSDRTELLSESILLVGNWNMS